MTRLCSWFWRWILDTAAAQRRIEERAERIAQGRARRIAASKVADEARRVAAAKLAAERTEASKQRDESRGFWKALRLVAEESLTPDLIRDVVDAARTARGSGFVGWAINGRAIPAPPRDVWRDA